MLSCNIFIGCNKRDSEKLIIAVNAGQPPYTFYDDNYALTGFEIDLIKEIAKRMNKEYSIVVLPFNQLIPKLSVGHVDFIAAGQHITPERKKIIDFSIPYGAGFSQLAVKEDSNIKSIEDIKGTNLKIGVRNGTTYAKYLINNGFLENTKIFPFQKDLHLAFFKDQINAILTDKYIIKYLIKERDFKIHLVGNCVMKFHTGITVKKGNFTLLNTINKTLNDMMKDGTYQKIALKWFRLNPLDDYDTAFCKQ